MLARVLDRAIAEAKAEAPKVGLILDTIGIVANTPIRAVAKRIEAVAEMDLIAEQHQEFRKTGKVRETLGDDDRAVRKLFAEEVLKVSLSTLDCQWPSETGTKSGQGAPARVTKKVKSAAAAKPAKTAKEPKAPQQVVIKEKMAVAPKAATGAAPAAPRIRLSREAAVVDAPSIGPKTAGRLAVIGVNTVGDLLALTPEDAAQRIKASHINAGIIKDWQAQALLACSVPDLTGTFAQILVGAGVYSVDDLATTDLDSLMDAIELFASSNEGERLLRDGTPPPRERVKGWIEAALTICENRSAA